MEKTHPDSDVVQGEIAGVYERSNLTRLQLLYWMGHRLRPESPMFNTILSFAFSGKVDRECFEKAFCAVVEHCDALRTVIQEVDGVPQRKILSDIPCSLEYEDFSSNAYPEEALQTWLAERSVIPLNIESCLFDSVLLKTAPDHYVWYLNQDHLVTDASSFMQIYELTAKFYVLSLKGEPLRLSGLPSFENYVEYERNYRSSPQALRAEAYWKQKLTPGPDLVRFYGSVPNKKSTHVQRISYDLGIERSQKLRAIANRKDIFTVSEDLSMYNIFAALFFAQLYRLSGNQRIGFVTPVHNRFNEVSRNTVGLLLELCPYQVEISDSETFLSLIKKTKRETRETLAYYQYGSGLSLQQESFDAMFNMYRMSVPGFDTIPAQVKRIHPGHGSESLVLHVNDLVSSGNFLLNFDFHYDVFTEDQREQTIQSFVESVDRFLEDDTCQIDRMTPVLVETPDVRAASNGTNRSTDHQRSGAGLPQDMLEMQLVCIWEEILDVRPIGVNDNFFDLGGNSWLAVNLFVEIEKSTGQYLPLTTLVNMATVSDLAKCIRQELGSSLWSTLVTIQPGGDRTPLYMVPGAGGNGLAVSRITKYLDEDQPVYMFQIPLGDGIEEPPFTRIVEMAAQYVKALRADQPEGPYYLGGYSAGGLIAFEMAQQLIRQGQKVDFLVILDVAAQGAFYKYLGKFSRRISVLFGFDSKRELWIYLKLRDKLFRFNYFARLGYRESIQRYSNRLKDQLSGFKQFLYLDRQEKSYLIRRKFRPMNGKTSTDMPDNDPGQAKTVEEGDLMWQTYDRYMERYFRFNSIAVKYYVPDSYPGRITLFRSSEGYKDLAQRSPDPLLGWGRIAKGGLEVYEVPGNHMQIVREPNVKALGEQLRCCLDQTQVIDHKNSIAER